MDVTSAGVGGFNSISDKGSDVVTEFPSNISFIKRLSLCVVALEVVDSKLEVDVLLVVDIVLDIRLWYYTRILKGRMYGLTEFRLKLPVVRLFWQAAALFLCVAGVFHS